MNPIPVVLFAYARPEHLQRGLRCLRESAVPLIYAYADGAKCERDAPAVTEARALLRAVDWAEVRLVERDTNVGLGRNILTGVSEVAAKHEAFIVWEDDLLCVPGTYAWMCAALRHYAADERVMSVTAWTHPRVVPAGLGAEPYFDARAECWGWGAWSRSWQGMAEQNTVAKMGAVVERGLPVDAYGADLPAMARAEERRNIWAVRWLYHHLARGGLCLRPPWSMVEHEGFGEGATNATGGMGWSNLPLRPAPPVPAAWPDAVEHRDCRSRWQRAEPGGLVRLWRRVRAKLLAR